MRYMVEEEERNRYIFRCIPGNIASKSDGLGTDKQVLPGTAK